MPKTSGSTLPGQVQWSKELSPINNDSVQLHLTSDEEIVVTGIDSNPVIPVRIELATRLVVKNSASSNSIGSDVRKLMGTGVVLQNGNSVVLAFPQGNPQRTELFALGSHPWNTTIVDGPSTIVGTALDQVIGIASTGRSSGVGEERIVSIDGFTGVLKIRKIGNWPPFKLNSSFIGFALPGIAVTRTPETASSITLVDAATFAIIQTLSWTTEWKLFDHPPGFGKTPMVATSEGLIVLSGYDRTSYVGGLIVVDAKRKAPTRFLKIANIGERATGMAVGRDGVVYFSLSNGRSIPVQTKASGRVGGIRVETGEETLFPNIQSGVESAPLITKTGILVISSSGSTGLGNDILVGISTPALGGLARTPWPRSTGDNQNSWREQSVSDEGGPTSTTTPIDPVGQQCSGLSGEYFSGRNFDVFKFSRIDDTVDFQWLPEGRPARSPDPSIELTDYSVRWTGFVQPQFTEEYNFHTLSDDGVRLWVDDGIVIDNWTLHGPTLDKGSISLVAGVRYRVRLEYFQGPLSEAVIRLFWSSAKQPLEIIPSTRLSCRGNSPPSIAIPTLALIANQTIAEGSLLTFNVTGMDADIPSNTLAYSLGPNTPLGASIHPTTGLFTWTPTEVQGPSTNIITVRATDNGTPNLSATTTFTVTVNEVNLPPILSPIPGQTVRPGDTLTIRASATDPDIPANTLTFSLDAGAPIGASIEPITGVFTWKPVAAFGQSTNLVTARVTDNGVPPLSDTKSFTIVVQQKPPLDEPPRPVIFYGTPEIYSSPAIGLAGDIHFGSLNHQLFTARSDNTTNWIRTLTDVVNAAPSIGPDGTIYVSCYRQIDGQVEPASLYAYTPDGQVKWKHAVDEAIRIDAPVAITKDGTLYLAASLPSASGLLIALNPEGKRLWTVPFDGQPDRALAIGLDGTLYIGSSMRTGNGMFFALTPNGGIQWNYDVGRLVTSGTAIGAEGEVYFGAENGVHAVSSEGKGLWRFGGIGGVHSSPAIAEDGTIYFGSDGGLFFALTAEGNEKWKFEAKGGIYSSPAIGADGSIYFGSRGREGTDANGVFYALNPNGTVKWVVNMSDFGTRGDGGSPNYVDASPVISPDGILYFCAVDARLYALDIGIALATSPWPMYGHDRFHTFRAQPIGPVFRDPQFNLLNGFQASLTGLSSRPTTVQYSTNLIHWQTLTNLPTGPASLIVRDPNSTQPRSRFYRAVRE